MKKQFYDAIYPAQRTSKFSKEETIAHAAYEILRDAKHPGDSRWLNESEQHLGQSPIPNKSARYSTKNRASNTQTIIVEASAAFFEQVEDWLAKAA